MNTAGFVTSGPMLTVHIDEGVYWAECPACPGFTAAASTWGDLMRLVGEFHRGPTATHHAWTMYLPLIVSGASGPDAGERKP